MDLSAVWHITCIQMKLIEKYRAQFNNIKLYL